jgi:hypothetical protein
MALNGRSFLLEHIAHLKGISGVLYPLAMNFCLAKSQNSWVYSEERFPEIGF